MRNDDNGREEEAPLIEGTADASTMAKRKCAPCLASPPLRTVRLTVASVYEHMPSTRTPPGLAGGCM